ncbi:MAG TPA: AIPR family protein [Pyrinomonadaceae bacterium]|nr:AIPR family protein [Pyrinomonadaceae bacterium]
MFTTLQFTPAYARRFPDPLNSQENGQHRIEHHLFVCDVKSLPFDPPIPTDPNPREQNTNKQVYKDVRKSLLEGGPTFHLKNKGITAIAHSVNVDEEKRVYTVNFTKGRDGIVDGGHTYRIIRENYAECPDGQFVKIEILTGVPDDLIVDIAQGLNTSVQVPQMALANLDKRFEWIKDALKNKPYSDQIAYKQNEEGEFTVRDIISFLTLFNLELFPDDSSHPKIAYTSKEECLKRYLKEQPSYEKLRPILSNILELYDYVHSKGRELYNRKYAGKGGSLKFYQDKKKKPYPLIFTGGSTPQKLYDGALYPILGAFRFLVERNLVDGTVRWKTSSFAEVKKLFDEVGGDLINLTQNTSISKGRNPNAIGKDDSHWDNLYKTVALAYVQKQLAAR